MSDDAKYRRPFPEVIRLEPAATCNLRCIHCPTGCGGGPKGLMTPETFEVLLEQLRPHGPRIRVAVLYHGGEPLLNKHFFRMAAGIKQLGVPFVKTVSNGMLLDKQAAGEMIDCGIDAVEFSLDGLSPEDNDRIRRGDDFRRVVTNVRRLLELKKSLNRSTPKVSIASTQFIDQALTDDLAQAGSAVAETFPLAPLFLRECFDDFPEVEFLPTWAMLWPAMSLDRQRFSAFTDTTPQHLTRCGHLDEVLTIRHNGDIVPCCLDLTSRYVIGNALEDGLEGVWNNPRMLAIRRAMATGRHIAPCDSCLLVNTPVFLIRK